MEGPPCWQRPRFIKLIPDSQVLRFLKDPREERGGDLIASSEARGGCQQRAGACALGTWSSQAVANPILNDSS